ncbi:hypothetical protein [Haladaptatus cibarius]|uniref:hypothetical protein n=1 Tax=Haladaptatus cibarius TaxID=453847 RepID=UPI0006795337|nr:hypothetical protein [Haladaptatus cibarius]
MFTHAHVGIINEELPLIQKREKTETEEGLDLLSVIEISQELALDDTAIISGQAALQELTTIERIQIGESEFSTEDEYILRMGQFNGVDIMKNEEISVQEDLESTQNGSDFPIETKSEVEKKTRSYDIFGIQGEFVAVSGENPSSAFSLLTDITGIEIKKVEFDLESILQETGGASWMGTFSERSGNVRSGTLYGEQISFRDYLEDDDDGRFEQIGPVIEFGGEEVKMRITRDGLVQVVSPGGYRKSKLSTLISEILIEFAE